MNDVIKKIYFDPAGYGSIKTTYEDAKRVDNKIKFKDVQEWFKNNVERKKQLKGYNSFIVNEPFEEFQIDLVFFPESEGEYKIGLTMIDIFSKYATCIPIKSKQVPDVAAGILEGFVKMRGKPKMIYSDNEGSFGSNLMQEFFEKEKKLYNY